MLLPLSVVVVFCTLCPDDRLIIFRSLKFYDKIEEQRGDHVVCRRAGGDVASDAMKTYFQKAIWTH